MLPKKKPYGYRKVKGLIKKDELSEAMHYMSDFTESRKLSSPNFELIGCCNRLKKIKGDYRKDVIDYTTYTLKRNKIVNHLVDLNVEINELNAELNQLNEPTRKITQISNIKKALGFILSFTLLFLLIFYAYIKTNSNENGILSIESTKREFVIEDFYISEHDCINPAYATIKVKNTSKNDLKNISFKWRPDISVPEHFLTGQIENLSIQETDTILIPIKNSNQKKPARYRSSLEEDHPNPVFTTMYQHYEIKVCQKEALPDNLQKGDSVKISYVLKHEKTTLLKEDSISIPVNSTISDIKKIPE